MPVCVIDSLSPGKLQQMHLLGNGAQRELLTSLSELQHFGGDSFLSPSAIFTFLFFRKRPPEK